MLGKCEVCYSLKLVLTPNESHWPYQGGNLTILGEFIYEITHKKDNKKENSEKKT